MCSITLSLVTLIYQNLFAYLPLSIMIFGFFWIVLCAFSSMWYLHVLSHLNPFLLVSRNFVSLFFFFFSFADPAALVKVLLLRPADPVLHSLNILHYFSQDWTLFPHCKLFFSLRRLTKSWMLPLNHYLFNCCFFCPKY